MNHYQPLASFPHYRNADPPANKWANWTVGLHASAAAVADELTSKRIISGPSGGVTMTKARLRPSAQQMLPPGGSSEPLLQLPAAAAAAAAETETETETTDVDRFCCTAHVVCDVGGSGSIQGAMCSIIP